jgi:hypothetical protein
VTSSAVCKEWLELSNGTLAKSKQGSHVCLHPENKPMKTSARAYCAVSKGASTIGMQDQ